MEAGDVHLVSFDAPRTEQKVHVQVSSPDVPIDVHVVLQKDQDQARSDVLNYKKPTGSLVSKEKSREASLDATIPAGSGFAVLLSGAGKKTPVTVKVTGR
jgi:hypothetical protein